MDRQTQDLHEQADVDALPKVEQIILGYACGYDEQARPLVSFVYGGERHQFPALMSGSANSPIKGQQVALSFISGEVHLPIILGVIYSPLTDLLANIEVATHADSDIEPVDSASTLLEQPVTVDGKKVLIEGTEQVELRCGDASITLTKAGKILIRGKYLLNRATGVNRIVGGSVQVN